MRSTDLVVGPILRELLVRLRPVPRPDPVAETQLSFFRCEIREPGSKADSNRWRHPYFLAEALSGQYDMLNLAVK